MKGDFVVTRVGHYRQRAVSFGAADTYGSGPVTVRQLTDEERERLDKLLGPPRMPLKSKRPLAAMQQRATNPRDVKRVPVKEPDTVFVTKNASVYHTSANCYKARGAVQKPLAEAKKQGLKLCGWCKMEAVKKNG